MSSKTQIANLALQRIGVSKQVANVDTENSTEAKAIRLIFETERDAALRSFPWAFATSYATLGLVDGSSDDPANNDWIYSYRYPSDCIFVRRIVTTLGRNETNPPEWRVGRDAQGRLIYANVEDVEIEYTVRVTDPEEFDPLFVSAFAWKLAAGLAPALARIEGLARSCQQMFQMEAPGAQSRSMNEGQGAAPLESEWTRARG